MCLYFLYQRTFTISSNPRNFRLHRTALLGMPLMEHSWVFSYAPKTGKKTPENFLILKIYYQTEQNCFVLIWIRNKLTVVTKGSSPAVRYFSISFLLTLFWNSTTLDDLPDLVKGQKFSRFLGKRGISDLQVFLATRLT